MKERLAAWFPFVLAICLPVAGLVYGLIQMGSGQRAVGARVAIASVLAGIAWVLFLTA